jgi:hypothetical protein
VLGTGLDSGLRNQGHALQRLLVQEGQSKHTGQIVRGPYMEVIHGAIRGHD